LVLTNRLEVATDYSSIDGTIVPEEKSLVHLRFPYGKTLLDTKYLIICSLKEKIEKTYGALA